MAIPWLVVLQSVPWTDVIRNAPKVADGAKKLWSAVSRKKSTGEATPAATHDDHPSPEAHTPAMLLARIARMEAANAELHEQMLASSELIKTLAEQNTLLVERVEANRRRVAWLTALTVVLALLVAITLVR